MTRDNLHRRQFDQSQFSYKVSNQSGETVPAYACMKIDGPPYRANNRGPWIYDVVKPDADVENNQNYQHLIFNTGKPIGDKLRGSGTRCLPTQAIVGGDPLFGDSVGPAADSWKLWRGGLTHTMLSEATTLGGSTKFAKVGAPQGFGGWIRVTTTIPAKSGMTPGTALADIVFQDSSASLALIDSESPVSGSLRLRVHHGGSLDITPDVEGYESTTLGQVKMIQGRWVVDVHYCG